MDNIQELNKRNTIIVEQVLKEMQSKIYEQQKRIDGLNNVMSNITTRMNQLEQIVFIQRAQLIGHGASVK